MPHLTSAFRDGCSAIEETVSELKWLSTTVVMIRGWRASSIAFAVHVSLHRQWLHAGHSVLRFHEEHLRAGLLTEMLQGDRMHKTVGWDVWYPVVLSVSLNPCQGILDGQ